MIKYHHKHMEVPEVPMAVLAMDTVGVLPVTSRAADGP